MKNKDILIRKHLSYLELQKRVTAQNGKLNTLERDYKGSKCIVSITCKNYHNWKPYASSVMRGHQCKFCKNIAPYNINDLIDHAKKNGGICHSTEYSGKHSKYDWECARGHRWSTSFHSIHQGTWCRECKTGFGERASRQIIEFIFKGYKFPNKKPDFLKTKNIGHLTLDGYCEELKIAFEHQGPHHYGKQFRYKGNYKTDLKLVKQRDLEKIKLCKINNVLLIVIPQIDSEVTIRRAIDLIFDCLRKHNKLPKISKEDVLNNTLNKISDYQTYYIDKCKIWAQDKGGLFLSKEYLGSTIKHKWKCKNNHEFEMTPGNVGQGKWCGYCVGKNKNYDTIVNEFLHSNLILLEKKYNNCRTPMNTECQKCLHKWGLSYSNFKKGHRCPRCALSRASEVLRTPIHILANYASDLKGKLINITYYRNSKSYLLWECSNGHKWWSSWNNVKRGGWCMNCKGRANRYPEEINPNLKHNKPINVN